MVSFVMEDNQVLNIEVWKQIPNLPYEISSLGKIRNLKGKVLKTYIQNSGYEQIKLNYQGLHIHKSIHRLVAEAFIANPLNKIYVNHIDGNKLNNTVNNLEWCTNSENILHARKTGLNPYNKPTLGLKLKPRSKTAKQSQYLGVFWDNARQQWKAYVVFNKVKYLQKRYKSEYEAALARDTCIKQYSLPLPLNFN
jgi:hypothetical protein